MTRNRIRLGASLLLVSLAFSPLYARNREIKTVETATDVVGGLSVIPWGLLHDAAGVAIIPRTVKAALVVDGEFGRGVVVLHEPDGRWSNPIFVTLKGTGIGGQAGIEKTDVVLIFRTKKGLDRALQGRLTLGQDVALAAGPVGRDIELATSGKALQADVLSYSRSHGLFAGVSLERARLHIDTQANKAFYGLREGSHVEVLAHRGAPHPATEALKARLLGLRPPTGKPAVIVAPAPLPPPPPRRRY